MWSYGPNWCFLRVWQPENKSWVFWSTVGHWHPKSNKDCPDGFAKADKSQSMLKLVAASWLAPRVKSSTMVPSGSSGDNSRSAVKSGVVPVRINNRPTFLGASAPKWRGGNIGFLKWGTKVILQDPKCFRYFFMSKPVVFGSQIPWPRVMNLAHLGALDVALPCPSHPIPVPLRSGCNWSSWFFVWSFVLPKLVWSGENMSKMDRGHNSLNSLIVAA